MNDDEIKKRLETAERVIVAYRVLPGQRLAISHVTQCDLCGHDIGALKESIAKTSNPGFAIICREVCYPAVVRILGPRPYGGTFNTPEEFKKVFP